MRGAVQEILRINYFGLWVSCGLSLPWIPPPCVVLLEAYATTDFY